MLQFNADGGDFGRTPEQEYRIFVNRLKMVTGRSLEQIEVAIARHDSDVSKYHDPQDPEPFCMICFYRNIQPMLNAC